MNDAQGIFSAIKRQHIVITSAQVARPYAVEITRQW